MPDKPGQFWFDISEPKTDEVEIFVFVCGVPEDFFVFTANGLREIFDSLNAPRASKTGKLLFRIDMRNKLLIAREKETQDIAADFRKLDRLPRSS